MNKMLIAVVAAASAFAAYSNTYYVKKTGSDTPGDGSADNPFLTIQKGVTTAEAAGEGHTIIVGPGDYGESEGTRTGKGDDTCLTRLLVQKRNHIVSSDGPEVTRIIGKHSANANGLGDDAVRCVTFYFGNKAMLEGFTLCNGATKNSDASAGYGGGVLCHGLQTDVWINNCIISNCVAKYGCVSQHGVLVHCKILSNVSPAGGSMMRQSHVYGCLIVGNKGGACGESGYMAQSTFVRNDYPYGGTLRNNVCVGNWQPIQNKTDAMHSVEDKTDGLWLVADSAGGDYRPTKAGVSALAGSKDAANGKMTDSVSIEFWGDDGWWTKLPRAKGKGIDGVAFTFTGDRCAAGAYGEVLTGVGITADQGGLAITGGTTGFVSMTEGSSVTISRGAATRPCIGYAVNGVTNLFDETESRTFAYSDVTAAGGGLDIAGLYTSDWYVNANTDSAKGVVGNDANYGYTPGNAKRTLKGAMEASGLASGDTVHAAPGDYNDLTMLQTSPLQGGTPSVAARVVVPSGVQLVADGGREVTFITGAGDSTGTAEGLGPNAIRCVALWTGASVRGFTIRNGRTNSTANDWIDDSTAAGVLGKACESVRVLDCTISNCVGYVAGALRKVTVERSKVLYCSVTKSDSTITQSAAFYNTFFDYNKASYLNIFYHDIVNCTFGSHNLIPGISSYSYAMVYNEGGGVVKNTLSILPSLADGKVQRSYFTSFAGSPTKEDGTATKTVAQMAIDANGRPIIGSSCAVDAANASYLTGTHADGDADGGQRVYNGTLDIGCFEADWRATYARDISKSSRFSVTAASPTVVEEATAKTVRIPAGAKLGAEWSGSSVGSCRLTVNLPGTGTLTATSNGAAIASVTGPVSGYALMLKGSAVAFPFELAYSGDDSYAEILNCRSNAGLQVLVR